MGTRSVLHETAGCNLLRWKPRLLLSKLFPVLQDPNASKASLSLRCNGGNGKKEPVPLPDGLRDPATLGVLAWISWIRIHCQQRSFPNIKFGEKEFMDDLDYSFAKQKRLKRKIEKKDCLLRSLLELNCTVNLILQLKLLMLHFFMFQDMLKYM